jgi:hypothetical protein
VTKQREKEEQEQEFERSDESDSATVTTPGENLNTSEMSTRNVFNAAECAGSIIVPENVDDYSQDNLIEIYHDDSFQVV